MDIHSYGVMMWNMWTGLKDPFRHVTGGPREVERHVSAGGRPIFPTDPQYATAGADQVARLAARCWAEDPAQVRRRCHCTRTHWRPR